MTTTTAGSARQRPHWPIYPQGACSIYFLAAATFGPHSEPWQPGVIFGSAPFFLLNVLELALQRAKHCSKMRPEALLHQETEEEDNH